MTIRAKALEFMQHGPVVRVDVCHHPASVAELSALGLQPPHASET